MWLFTRSVIRPWIGTSTPKSESSAKSPFWTLIIAFRDNQWSQSDRIKVLRRNERSANECDLYLPQDAEDGQHGSACI